jgi:hypothetical protein
MDTLNDTENSPKFVCFFCDYKCFKKSDMNKHTLTKKHINCEKEYKKNTENTIPNFYFCNCGKKYSYHSGLWKHKKICTQKASFSPDGGTFTYDINKTKNEQNDKELILILLKQNNELQNKVLEFCKNGINNNNNNNNTITNINNKTFNIQFFLNETCKNAMNITDFVDSIKLQLADLENVGKIGYVEGLSNIIIKSLNNMDVTERPVHCSDSKRDTIYVKDENKWEKENDDHKKVIKAIEDIANKNTKLICEWKKQNPECSSSKSVKADQYSHILIEALCSNNDTNNQKVLKKLAKEVIIDKNILV